MKSTLAATAILLSSTLAAPAFDIGNMTDAEREAFGSAVRSYLLENPEVIVEVIDVLEAREREQARQADRDLVAANAEALFENPDAWVGGNPEGDVTIVEFLDYRCGYCRRAHPEVAALLDRDPNIRIIVKEFPILGEDSDRSSRFALATRKVAGDDAYKDVSDALIELETQASDPILRRLAEDLGLDADAILGAMQDDDISAMIASNRALAQRMNITGTPSFVFGDTMVRGYVPLNSMVQIVRQVRENAG